MLASQALLLSPPNPLTSQSLLGNTHHGTHEIEGGCEDNDDDDDDDDGDDDDDDDAKLQRP